MSTNAVLAYLDSLQPKPGFNAARNREPFFNRDLTESEDLEALLSDIKHKAAAQTKHTQREAANFFAPYGLRHPQLIILLETLRCKLREEVKKPNFSEEAKAILNETMVLTTLLDVVSRDCMSNPYVDEALNFGGCDFIKLEHRQDPYKFYEYGYKLKNRTGIIQTDDEQLYQVTLVEKSLYNELWQVPLKEQHRYKVEPLLVVDKLKHTFKKIPQNTSREATETELKWLQKLTHGKIQVGCTLTNLPGASLMSPEEPVQGRAKQGWNVIYQGGLLFVQGKDGKKTQIHSDQSNVFNVLDGLESGSERRATALQLSWVKALTTRADLKACEFMRLPGRYNPLNANHIQAFITDLYGEQILETSAHRFGVLLHRNTLYTIEYVVAANTPGKWVVKKLVSPSDKILSVFEKIRVGDGRSAISSELPAIAALVGRRCSTNRKQELRAVYRSRLWGDIDEPEFKNYEAKPLTFISWLCERIQAIFVGWNDLRLGGLRGRRLSAFIGNLLVAFDFLKQYGEAWRSVHNFLESHGVLFLFANLGWLFFLPRLLRNLSVLFYHVLSDLFYDSKLSPLEAAMDRTTRFRIHWMRCWDEVVNDSYWLANGLAFRFLFYGVVSVTTIQINLLTQAADLLNAGIRAGLLISRLYTLENDLIKHKMPLPLRAHLRERINFEQQFLLYTVFHFVVLLAAMLMTLPSAAAISPLLPVIGAVCAVIMTIVTWWMRSGFQAERQKRFQQENLETDMPASAETSIPLNRSVFG